MAIDLRKKKEDVLKTSMKKTLEPGVHTCTIRAIEERDVNTQSIRDGITILLTLEGPDLTDQGFEGFNVEYNNPDSEKFKGQSGTIKLSDFPYSDRVVKKNGKEYVFDRDGSIISDLGKMANECGKLDEFMDAEVEDIHVFIKRANDMLVGSVLTFVIAGTEYQKGEYTNYYLYLPSKVPKGKKAFESPEAFPSKLMEFNPLTLVTVKAQPLEMEEFSSELGQSDDLPFIS